MSPVPSSSKDGENNPSSVNSSSGKRIKKEPIDEEERNVPVEEDEERAEFYAFIDKDVRWRRFSSLPARDYINSASDKFIIVVVHRIFGDWNSAELDRWSETGGRFAIGRKTDTQSHGSRIGNFCSV